MKTDKSICINSIELEIGGVKIKLALEQVAELKKILAKAFPEPETRTVYVPGPERIRERPYPMPVPHWMTKPMQTDEWRVTCQANEGLLKFSAVH